MNRACGMLPAPRALTCIDLSHQFENRIVSMVADRERDELGLICERPVRLTKGSERRTYALGLHLGLIAGFTEDASTFSAAVTGSPRLSQRDSAAALSDSVIAAVICEVGSGEFESRSAAIASGTLIVDHAGPVAGSPSIVACWLSPTALTAMPRTPWTCFRSWANSALGVFDDTVAEVRGVDVVVGAAEAVRDPVGGLATDPGPRSLTRPSLVAPIPTAKRTPMLTNAPTALRRDGCRGVPMLCRCRPPSGGRADLSDMTAAA